VTSSLQRWRVHTPLANSLVVANFGPVSMNAFVTRVGAVTVDLLDFAE